jgi:DNA-binding protein H-NS
MCTCKVLTAMAQLEEQLATARVAEAEKRKKEASGASQRIVVKFTAIRL